jgi:hypothetical protein
LRIGGAHTPAFALHQVPVAHIDIVADLFLQMIDEIAAGRNLAVLDGVQELHAVKASS